MKLIDVRKGHEEHGANPDSLPFLRRPSFLRIVLSFAIILFCFFFTIVIITFFFVALLVFRSFVLVCAQVLVEDNAIDGVDKVMQQMIQDMIMGTAPTRDPSRSFLYEIVANKRNNIDVDKFDYIARDCRSVGLQTSFDYRRLALNARVLEGEICFQAKQVHAVGTNRPGSGARGREEERRW